MTAILSRNVKLFDGFPPGTGTIAIGDDNSFTLTKIDTSTNQPIATLMSTPINQLQVRGSATALRLVAGGIRKRVNFSLGSEFVRGELGLVGDIAGGVMAKKSGVKDVVAALRKGGADVRYLSYWQRILLIWGIVIVFIIVIIGIIALAALAQH
ncbi:MAG TPA: hypothetical protein VHX87_13495 [Galbitalea sp.]|jgi:hypothetical protein|nr:hypothetical protein [Galbitalea sp.]